MRRLLTACLAGALVAAAPLRVAEADHRDFRGGCTGHSVHQQNATGQSWEGLVSVTVVAMQGSAPAPATSVSGVSCELFVNGASGGVVLTAPDATGSTAGAGRLVYRASSEDEVLLCTSVTLDREPLRRCTAVATVPVPPPSLSDAAKAALDEVKGVGDPLLCPVLIGVIIGLVVALIIEELGDAGIAHTGGDDGEDPYLLGSRVWDCPPYTAG